MRLAVTMRRLLSLHPRWRWPAIAALALGALAVLLLALLLAAPLGMLKPVLERALTERFGRPVTIASLERGDVFTLTPSIVVRGLRVPQPAGFDRGPGPGMLATIDRVALTFPLLPALAGRFRPSAVALSGARLDLVRAADRRTNWQGTTARGSSRGGGGLERLTASDVRIRYRDAVQDRVAVLTVAADPARGLVAQGRGTVRGEAVSIAVRGAAMAPARPWPFRATIDGAALAIDARGTMARPLDTATLTLDVTARGRDLKMIDAIIEAGLFETRPVALAAHVERSDGQWRVSRLTGTVGQSRIAGRVTVDKVDGRTRVSGAMTSDRLDFTDFASPASTAAGKAREAAIGPRLVPDTRINLAKIGKTDGRVAFRVTRVVAQGGSNIRTLAGTATLDRRRLTIEPLTIGLAQGAIRGRIVVDQQGGTAVPRATYDLRLAGSSVAALGGGGGSVTGRVDGRAYLVGRGSTVRASVAASDGRIGLVARDGALPARFAAALGFDAGRALVTGGDARAGLNCVVAAFDVRGGTGRARTFVVDTTQSRLDGQGTLTFPSETLAIRLTGAPKRDAVLRLPGSATLGGSIRAPDIAVPREVKSVGNVLKAIGRAITGRNGPVAADADCARLGRAALR